MYCTFPIPAELEMCAHVRVRARTRARTRISAKNNAEYYLQ